MIKINLIPPEKIKKTKKKKKKTPSPLAPLLARLPKITLSVNEMVPITIGVVLLLLVIAAGIYLMYYFNKKTDELNAKLKQNQQMIADLDSQIKDIKDLEADKARLEQREKLISTLRQNQAKPIKILDEISASIPDTVWIDSLNMGGNGISLSGSGLSYYDVVTFVDNLKKVEIFRDVFLVSANRAEYQGQIVFTYAITLSVK